LSTVVGIPKTVDNDVAFVVRTFGYLTAVQEAGKVLDRAQSSNLLGLGIVEQTRQAMSRFLNEVLAKFQTYGNASILAA
jgi:hypothetical protein